MKYQVIIEPPAEREAEDAFVYISKSNPENADRWFHGLETAFASLSHLPHRCPLAPESSVFPCEIHQLIYGVYRILFAIEGSCVHILHLRHGAREHLKPPSQ